MRRNRMKRMRRNVAARDEGRSPRGNNSVQSPRGVQGQEDGKPAMEISNPMWGIRPPTTGGSRRHDQATSGGTGHFSFATAPEVASPHDSGAIPHDGASIHSIGDIEYGGAAKDISRADSAAELDASGALGANADVGPAQVVTATMDRNLAFQLQAMGLSNRGLMQNLVWEPGLTDATGEYYPSYEHDDDATATAILDAMMEMRRDEEEAYHTRRSRSLRSLRLQQSQRSFRVGLGETAESAAGAAAAPRAPRLGERPQSPRKVGQGGGRALPRAASWKAASLDEARRHADMVHPRRANYVGDPEPWPVCCGTHTGQFCTESFDRSVVSACCCDTSPSHLAVYGPGITIYFKQLKWFIWVFFLMSLVMSPVMVLNAFGVGDQGAGVELGLDSLSVGNLGDANNVTEVFIPGTQCGPEGDSRPCSMNKARMAEIYAICCGAAGLLFLAGFIWLRVFEKREANMVDKDFLTVADFSVRVVGIPPNADELSVKEHMERVTSYAVADVHLAEDNENVLRLYLKRGKIVKQLETIQEELALLRHEHGKERKIRKLEGKRAKLERSAAELRQLAKAGSKHGRVIAAFVTFESPLGRKVALDLYKTATPLLYYCQDHSLRFTPPPPRHGESADQAPRRLTVTPAPDPSTIQWQNLSYSRCDRTGRRTVTSIATILLLAVSFAFLMWASDREARARESGGEETCPELDAEGNFREVTREEAEENPGILHCYCRSLSAAAVVQDDLCEPWLRDQTIALALTIAASGSVVIVNFLLLGILRKMGEFERHHSLESQAKSFAHRLFVSQFVNTGVLVLLVNAYIPNIPIEGNQFRDFSPDWYATVGAAIAVMMLLNIISPHVQPLYTFWRTVYCTRNVDPSRKLFSQRQLNERFTGPQFHLSTRYAQVMNTAFVCLIYSPGIPLLLPIAAVAMMVSFWIDKWLFLRLYRTPPRYNESLGRSMSSLLMIAFMIYLAFAVWMLGNPSIFQTGTDSTLDQLTGSVKSESFRDRVQQTHTMPFFITLVVVVALVILKRFMHGMLHALFRFLACITCGYCADEGEFDAEVSGAERHRLTYSKAIREGKIMGLGTYNVLFNPELREKLAVPEEFAAARKRISELKDATLPEEKVVRTPSRRALDEAEEQEESVTSFDEQQI